MIFEGEGDLPPSTSPIDGPLSKCAGGALKAIGAVR